MGISEQVLSDFNRIFYRSNRRDVQIKNKKKVSEKVKWSGNQENQTVGWTGLK